MSSTAELAAALAAMAGRSRNGRADRTAGADDPDRRASPDSTSNAPVSPATTGD